MRNELIRRVQEYPFGDLLLSAMIVGVAKVENFRIHLTVADLFVRNEQGGWKHFDLPVDLAGFPILAERPVEAEAAIEAAMMRWVSR